MSGSALNVSSRESTMMATMRISVRSVICGLTQTKDMSNSDEDALVERAKKAERIAQEAKLVAAVYREQIEHAVELARRAAYERHPDFLYGALSPVELALDEKNVKDWAKSWREAWKADIRWLESAISQMRKIEAAANKLDITEGSTNAEIQRVILTAARAVLVQYLPSSVGLDDAAEDDPDE